jgi:hypothetical protein
LQSSKIVGAVGVSFKFATTVCALLAMSAPAFAQDSAGRTSRAANDTADERVFEAGVAHMTVRAAFTPSTSLSQPELVGLFLMMSVPRQSAQNSMQGGNK